MLAARVSAVFTDPVPADQPDVSGPMVTEAKVQLIPAA
jgi:hypothetical protein